MQYRVVCFQVCYLPSPITRVKSHTPRLFLKSDHNKTQNNNKKQAQQINSGKIVTCMNVFSLFCFAQAWGLVKVYFKANIFVHFLKKVAY